jgi:hypothetical protein
LPRISPLTASGFFILPTGQYMGTIVSALPMGLEITESLVEFGIGITV